MLADIFADDDQYLKAATNFPIMLLRTINDELKSNWLTYGLYSIMDCLNKHLSSLNSLGHPTNPEDYKHYFNLNRFIA